MTLLHSAAPSDPSQNPSVSSVMLVTLLPSIMVILSGSEASGAVFTAIVVTVVITGWGRGLGLGQEDLGWVGFLGAVGAEIFLFDDFCAAVWGWFLADLGYDAVGVAEVLFAALLAVVAHVGSLVSNLEIAMVFVAGGWPMPRHRGRVILLRVA